MTRGRVTLWALGVCIAVIAGIALVHEVQRGLFVTRGVSAGVER